MKADNIDVKKWIKFAQMDYDTALNMVQLHRPIPIEYVCYHCQQSAEKILKAYAMAKKGTLIKTHDLMVLLNQCSEYHREFELYARSCVALTTYASISRYPCNIELTELQMQKALHDAYDVLHYAKQRLSEMGY